MFSQLLKLIPRTDFQRLVKETNAEHAAKGVSCWSQFVAMLFCQLGRAHSLREIEGGLKSCEGKLQHLGIEAPKRSSLAYANAHRPWQLYEKVFGQLYAEISTKAAPRRKFRFRNKLVSLDASTIDLCLSVFDWAKFRRTKGAVKLHLLLDHDGYLPCFAVITDGKVHDVGIAKTLVFPAGTVVVYDRAYVDYRLFGEWTEQGVYFVTRMKDNTQYVITEERQPPQHRGIVSDRVIELAGVKAEERCPYPLRRVETEHPDTGERLVFLTNHLTLGASTIAAIYKDRWAVELFFKAIKQNLKVKTFVGTTPNAVKTQLWCALIAILLLRYLQLLARFGWSMSNLVALLRMNLFTHRDLMAWLDQPFATPPDPHDQPQQAALALA
jgi:hypothetical protein